MSRPLPIVHIERLVGRRASGKAGGRLSGGELSRLADLLAEAEAATPSVAMLNAGLMPTASIDVPFLLLLTDPRRGSLAAWCHTLGMYGFSSVCAVAADDLGREGRVRRSDLALVTGSGAALASRGCSGEPLVGMSVSRLRDELRDSHRRLSEAAGFPVRLLVPTPTADGRTVDGLVAREAARVGFEMVFEPGGVARLDDPAPDSPVSYHTVLPGDDPERLRDWIVGDLFARGSANLERLAGGPRRLLERLGIESEG